MIQTLTKNIYKPMSISDINIQIAYIGSTLNMIHDFDNGIYSENTVDFDHANAIKPILVNI